MVLDLILLSNSLHVQEVLHVLPLIPLQLNDSSEILVVDEDAWGGREGKIGKSIIRGERK